MEPSLLPQFLKPLDYQTAIQVIWTYGVCNHKNLPRLPLDIIDYMLQLDTTDLETYSAVVSSIPALWIRLKSNSALRYRMIRRFMVFRKISSTRSAYSVGNVNLCIIPTNCSKYSANYRCGNVCAVFNCSTNRRPEQIIVVGPQNYSVFLNYTTPLSWNYYFKTRLVNESELQAQSQGERTNPKNSPLAYLEYFKTLKAFGRLVDRIIRSENPVSIRDLPLEKLYNTRNNLQLRGVKRKRS